MVQYEPRTERGMEGTRNGTLQANSPWPVCKRTFVNQQPRRIDLLLSLSGDSIPVEDLSIFPDH